MHIFEADYCPYVWREIEERLHVSASDAVSEGQRAFTREYLESNVIYGWRKRAMRGLPFKLVFDRVVEEMSFFGFGKMEIVDYRRGKLLVVRVRKPHDVVSLAWGIKGVLESVEGKPSEVAWTGEGEDAIVSLALRGEGRAAEAAEGEGSRTLRDARRGLSPGGNALPPGGGELDACPGCGLPLKLSELEWKPEEGTILRRGTRRRYVFASGRVMAGVVRELEARTGEDLGPMMVEITRLFYLAQAREDPVAGRGEAYGDAAGFLAACGLGEVLSLSYGEGHLEVTIGNPFYAPRLVGRVAALFESVEDRDSETAYRSPQPQILEIETRIA